MYYKPPHQMEDRSKVARMIKSIRSGDDLSPIVVNSAYAITGSHRIEAWNRLDMEHDAVEMSDLDYLRACFICQCEVAEECGDWNLFVSAVYEITESDEVKSALKDQRHDYEDMSTFSDRIKESLEMDAEEIMEWRGW